MLVVVGLARGFVAVVGRMTSVSVATSVTGGGRTLVMSGGTRAIEHKARIAVHVRNDQSVDISRRRP